MPIFDAHANLAVSTVAVAPTPVVSGTTVEVAAGHGVRFPVAPFNCTVWPAAASPDPTNAEVIRVTAVVGDTLTITRAQESSTARSIIAGDRIAATITAKTITDIENSFLGVPVATLQLSGSTHTVDLSTAKTIATATAGAYPDALLNWDGSATTISQNVTVTAPVTGSYLLDVTFNFGAMTMPAIGAGNSCRVEIERRYGIFGGLFGPAPATITWSDLGGADFDPSGFYPVAHADQTKDTYHTSAATFLAAPGFPFTAGDVLMFAAATRIRSISGTVPSGYTATTSAPVGKISLTRIG